jgi:conjugal transfer mating pair stabilization protein TraG
MLDRRHINLVFDLRANCISNIRGNTIAADLQVRLGEDYDVVFERFPNNPANDYIHVE